MSTAWLRSYGCYVTYKLWVGAEEDLIVSSTHGVTSLEVFLHTVTPNFDAILRSWELKQTRH